MRRHGQMGTIEMATAPDNRMQMRTMGTGDLPELVSLAKAERWPHRIEDIQTMLSLGDGIVAEVGGEVIGSTMWFPAGESTATVGLVMVAQAFRGGGIGRLLFDAALERGGCDTYELNATRSALPLCRRVGFQGVAEIVQHQGAAFQVPIVALDEGERLRPIGTRDHPRIAEMLRDATGLDRPAAIAHLIDTAQVVGLDREGELIGVSFFRRFGHGYLIGPVVAPGMLQAKALISHWLGSRAGEFTRIDVPEITGISDWLEELGLLRVGSVVTMIRGRPLVPQRGDLVSFAILSQAQG
jgi:GNAT superfamily N-acetyltransferase